MQANTLRRAADVFRNILPGLALFEVCYKMAVGFLLRPVFSWLADHALSRNAELAFNERIVGALVTPAGVLGIFLFLVLGVSAAYYEFTVRFLMAGCAARQAPCRLRMAAEMAVPALRILKSPGTLMFTLYGLGLLPLVDFGISPSLLPWLRIPNFITGELFKTPSGSALAIVFYLTVFLLFALLLFTLPHMALGSRRFGQAVRGSIRIWKTRWRQALLPLALFFAVWCFLFRQPGIVPTAFIGITGAGLPELISNLFSGRLLGSLPAFLASSALRIAFSTFLLSLCTVLYLDAGGEVNLDTKALPAVSLRASQAHRTAGRIWLFLQNRLRGLLQRAGRLPFVRRHKRLSAAMAAIFFFFFLGMVFSLPVSLHAPVAIGHRGGPGGVENTLEAVQSAIDAGADYAEVDVLLSKDGVPMVIHDTNLARLAGDNRNVYELTASQLQAVTLMQNGYRGHISTLEEMLRYCKGKIGLLIELKTHGKETADIARQVAQVVERQAAAGQCLFMSLDYGLVQAMNAIHPEYIIGYCVYGSMGSVDAGFLLANGINFLTIEENMVSPRLINRCLRAGLPVYVWTVDDHKSMRRYLAENVCGLISDIPALAAYAVSEYEGDSPNDFYRWQNEWLWGPGALPATGESKTQAGDV